jgi:hypothetical protein
MLIDILWFLFTVQDVFFQVARVEHVHVRNQWQFIHQFLVCIMDVVYGRCVTHCYAAMHVMACMACTFQDRPTLPRPIATP